MQIFDNIEFLNPEYFWLFLLLPIFVYLFYKSQIKWKNFLFLQDLKSITKWNSLFFYLKIFLFILIFINFIIIFANPNKVNSNEKITKNWIDIVLVLDLSKSMEATDLSPNRIESAKAIINDFVKNVKTDRLWLVVFAWKPFTSIPLTFDYDILLKTIESLTTKNISFDWTAVWDALLMAKTLFKAEHSLAPSLADREKEEKIQEDYKKREKVIILLTDWDANVWVEPILASKYLKNENIKVYTIWIWSKEWWEISFQVWPFIQKQKIPPLNEETLQEIAKNTSWEFFRADSNYSFEKILKELSKLNKQDIKIEVKKQYSPNYEIFIYILIFLLFSFSFLEFYFVKTR